MKIETKRRIAALVGYPFTFLVSVFDRTEAHRKDTIEHRELFKARIFGKRL